MAGTSARGGAEGGAGGSVTGGGGVAAVAGLPPVGGAAGSVSGGGVGGIPVVAPPVPQEGLELWFDAEQGVTSSAVGVAIWEDRSGHGRDALQTSADLSPTFVRDGLGGKPTIVFDGVDDFLEVPSLPGDFTRGVSIFLVGQTDGEGACMAYFEASNGPEMDDVHLGFWQSRYLYEVSELYLQVEVQQKQGSPELIVGWQQQTGDVDVRSNGNSMGKGNFPLPVKNARKSVYLGKTEYGNCTTLKGRVSELLVYSRGVSVKELLNIEAYLRSKWACCGQ